MQTTGPETARSTLSAVWLHRVALALLGAFALFLSRALEPHILGDDAAISFRYVERLVAGEGFRYNAHEAVQGASNPLYVLLLAGVHAAGADLESAARGLGSLLFAISVLLTAQLAGRLSRAPLGWIAGLALACDGFYRDQALSGMESVLAADLGLLAILFGVKGRAGAAGLCIGLALVNKLDAGFLALAVALAWLAAYRRVSLRMVLVAFAVFAPWCAFAAIYFGSPLPNSMLVKLGHHIVPFDRLWIAAHFGSSQYALMSLPIAFQLLASSRDGPPRRFGSWALAAWFLLHGLAFSLIDLGDNYPWYLTVMIPPWLCLAVAGISAGPRRLGARSWPGWLAAVAAASCVALSTRDTVRESTVSPLREGSPIRNWEAFDADRRLAGVFLERHSLAREVVESAFGWVAYESRRPFNDASGLNSRELLPDLAYWVGHGVPYATGSNPPRGPDGFVPVADLDLAADLFPGFSWFSVFARPDSSIARSRVRYLKQRLASFPEALPLGGRLALARVELPAGDLVSELPGGARFRFRDVRDSPLHLVFTPALQPASDASAGEGESAEFEVAWNGSPLQRVRVAGRGEPVVLALPSTAPDFELSLSAAIAATATARHARWTGLKLVRGELPYAAARLRNRALAQAWCRFNPCPADAAAGADGTAESRGSAGAR